jgi:hypothetical protein
MEKGVGRKREKENKERIFDPVVRNVFQNMDI